MRSVAGAGGVVDEERSIGRLGFLIADPVDRSVRHVRGR